MRICELRFEPVTDMLPAGFEALHEESVAEGHVLLARFAEGLASGAERYDGVTAHFLGVTCERALVALGGIAPDRYLADPTIGRLRHVYVARAFRRSGVGARLVRELLRLGAGLPAFGCAPSRLRPPASTRRSASFRSVTRMQHMRSGCFHLPNGREPSTLPPQAFHPAVTV